MNQINNLLSHILLAFLEQNKIELIDPEHKSDQVQNLILTIKIIDCLNAEQKFGFTQSQ